MEFLSRNPDIVQVHDAFTNSAVGVDASASTLALRINLKTEREIEQRLGRVTGLVSEGPRAADPTIIVNSLPGGHGDISADTVCIFSVLPSSFELAKLRFYARLLNIVAR